MELVRLRLGSPSMSVPTVPEDRRNVLVVLKLEENKLQGTSACS